MQVYLVVEQADSLIHVDGDEVRYDVWEPTEYVFPNREDAEKCVRMLIEHYPEERFKKHNVIEAEVGTAPPRIAYRVHRTESGIRCFKALVNLTEEELRAQHSAWSCWVEASSLEEAQEKAKELFPHEPA